VSTTPVRTRPKDRRQSIEAAAAGLFADRGFAGTSVADIAAEVGITPGAIYRHFSGKEELLERIVLGSLARIGEVVDVATADARARPRRRSGPWSARSSMWPRTTGPSWARTCGSATA